MRFRDAYAVGADAATALLPATHIGADTRAAATRAAARRLDPGVLSALRAQNPNPSGRAAEALDALATGEAAAVVTGQQVGLFGGPLYAVHKAAAAVHFADRLQRESGIRVVPVFWLQTEDHDFAEVCAHLSVSRAGAVRGDRVNCPQPARTAMGDRRLERCVAEALDGVDAQLAELPFGDDVFTMLSESWTPGATWPDAFAGMIRRLFRDTGLLVFSPRCAEIAALAAPVHRWATERHADIVNALTDRSDALRDAGFREQVPIRRDCALSFVHPDGPAGERFRLRKTRGGWCAAGHPAAFTDAELRDLLDEEPELFSTSAMLRPILQDMLLPTAAYVGGPGEVDYWAQVAALYPLARDLVAGGAPPMVVPRPSWRWQPDFVRSALERLDIAPEDVDSASDRGVDGLLALFPDNAPGPTGEDAASRAEQAIAQALSAVTEELAHLDDEPQRAAEKTLRTVRRNLEKYSRRVNKARRRFDARRVADARQALGWLAPNGNPQERSLGFASMAACVGVDRFIAACLDIADPLAPPPPTVPLPPAAR